jgi:phosphopantothenoylcysteine decarboxylase/phosphopantothenate--cysteine ligase
MIIPVEKKRILLGVTGSIAAYKAVDLASKLTQAGALVDVILTESALKFVSALSFQSVTGRKAYTDVDLWGGEGHIVHVGLGHPADMVVIAPASANTIAKLANGICDNLLTVAALAAARIPLVIAPAMDAGMFGHPATQANITTLQQRGATIIGPEEGRLASGLVGMGRFVEPNEIFGHVRFFLSRKGPLKGKRIVVTAGGTQEPIDPVRCITNRSSGKQGFALAQAALDVGTTVCLITTTMSLPAPIGAEVIAVRTAGEMQKKVLQKVHGAHALIMAAAVADFRPIDPGDQKLKKEEPLSSIRLEPTEDILVRVNEARLKDKTPKYIIGFAAETQDALKNAQHKMERKSLDCIVVNDVSNPAAGFEVDTNRVTILFPNGQKESLPLMTKSEVAEKILAILIGMEKK